MYTPISELLEKLSADIQRKCEYKLTPKELKPLRQLAVTLGKYFECQCNGAIREKLKDETWQQYDNDRNNIQIPYIEKRIIHLEKLIDKKCKALNIPYYIQGDPRGLTLYLGTTSDTRYDTEGVAIG
jgi:hypothetical protein